MGDKNAPRICHADSEGGMFLSPMGGERPDFLLGAGIGIMLVYNFLGVAIISDLFMNSIEMVTSWKKKVLSKETGRTSTVPLWNDTVATLTLMALGSSAPEIFLAVIEVIKKKFHAGSLGPSTIVGSAAFNQFAIIAVCIAVIPEKEIRRIENVRAFLVTAVFSVFAYVWMVIVLAGHGENVVDPYEAFLTFLFLPLLVWLSYSCDVGYLSEMLDKIWPTEEVEDTPFEKAHRVGFESDTLSVTGTAEPQAIEVIVTRKGGKKGKACCSFRTEQLSAVPGYDYETVEGTLDFTTGNPQATIALEILPKSSGSVTRSFLVILETAEGDNCDFDPNQDGGTEEGILTVTIEALDSTRSISKRLDAFAHPNALKHAFQDWKDQFISCAFVNGSYEEQQEASYADVVFHCFSLPWKVAFSVVPPTSFFGGWATFAVAIAFIGLCTAIVSDLAEMFGCLLDIPDIVTATVFVALGTSMPDLFASMTAAVQDPTADASVVNVTGSNAVNVFLGLGVPWIGSTLYWAISGRDADWEERYPEVASDPQYAGRAVFVVESQNLGFCVLVYSSLSVIALSLLVMRRAWLGGVLGGPRVPKYASSALLVWLWLAFAATTSWRVIRCDGAAAGDWCKASYAEQITVAVTMVLLTLGIASPAYISAWTYSAEAKEDIKNRGDAKKRRFSFIYGGASSADLDAGARANAALNVKNAGLSRAASGDCMAISEGSGDEMVTQQSWAPCDTLKSNKSSGTKGVMFADDKPAAKKAISFEGDEPTVKKGIKFAGDEPDGKGVMFQDDILEASTTCDATPRHSEGGAEPADIQALAKDDTLALETDNSPTNDDVPTDSQKAPAASSKSDASAEGAGFPSARADTSVVITVAKGTIESEPIEIAYNSSVTCDCLRPENDSAQEVTLQVSPIDAVDRPV